MSNEATLLCSELNLTMRISTTQKKNQKHKDALNCSGVTLSVSQDPLYQLSVRAKLWPPQGADFLGRYGGGKRCTAVLRWIK